MTKGLFDLGGMVAMVAGGNGGFELGFARGLAKQGGSLAIQARPADKRTAALAAVATLALGIGGCSGGGDGSSHKAAAVGEPSCGWPAAPHPWCDTSDSPSERAAILLKAMSQSEKIDLLTSKGAPASGVPSLRLQDGPLGAGGFGSQTPATAMPSGTALAASFNRDLARRYGSVVGAEIKHRGSDLVLGPNVNLMRTPLGGRNFEAFGEDPYLASQLVVQWVQGAQAQGIMANVKHYVANDQEGAAAGAVSRNYVSVNVDERTLHEIYMQPFEAAVTKGNAASVMCSYNRVNGTYACANAELLTATLRNLWNFQGFVLSDAGAAHETADDLNAGLNVDLLGTAYTAPQVTLALTTGQVRAETLDARVFEILRTMFAYGVFDRAPYPADPSQDDEDADNAVARQVAEEGITLLENKGVLPIDPDKVRTIAVMGAPASAYVAGVGSAAVVPYRAITTLDGIRARAAEAGVAVSYNDGSDPTAAAAAAKAADLVIVVAADTEGEGSDKLCLDLKPQCSVVANPGNSLQTQAAWGDQDGLIDTVAAANPAIVVVLQTGSPVLTPWRGSVAALLEAWYPGQDGGTAIARVLFGDVEPAGRLPATFPASASDGPTTGDPTAYPGVGADVNYKEGVMVGYRWYDQNGITPAYPLGHGLSYTTFSFSKPGVERAEPGRQSYRVSVTIANSGHRPGWTVPQVYVGIPSLPGVEQPPRQLAGFSKVYLGPGDSTRVSIPLDDRSFSYWDVASHGWRIAPGCHRILVGSSSRDLSLAGTVAQGASTCTP